MYTREILPPIASPIIDGDPVFGTWNRAFEKVDLQEIRMPYKYPVPRWIRENRIKELQSFVIQDDDYFLRAIFSNLKIYRMIQVMLYDKKSGQKLIYRKTRLGTGWQLPLSLANSSVDSRSSHFFFRIHTWLDVDTIRLDINIEATRKQPSLTIHLAYNVNNHDVTPMSVSLGFTQRRIMYAYKTLAPVRGDIVFGGRHITLKQDACTGLFCDCKGYYPYQMQAVYVSAVGFNNENERLGFHIAENQTRETNKNNENALWVNGKLSPLPPVKITMPCGTDGDWIIQDVEGMVDLTFTPKEPNRNGLNTIITKVDFNAPMGCFNGALVDSDGKKITIKNLFGIGEKLYLRV